MIIQQNIAITKPNKLQNNTSTQNHASVAFPNDKVYIENSFIDKKPLIDRKIIKPDENINTFFDKISNEIFANSQIKNDFSKLLKTGHISLSSNAYANLSDPKSAIAVKLNPQKQNSAHCAFLENYLKNGVGVGINFSEFSNPIQSINYINDYFKFREPNLTRPSAGIALLNVNHANILDFIALKEDKNYKNWCFDLSVVIDSSFLQKVDNNENITLSNGQIIKAEAIYFRLLNSMLKTGEPGIIFSDNPHFICDCCAAAELKENEGLNMAHINLAKFYNKSTKTIDYNLLSQSSNLLSQALKAIAPNGFVGILGYQDLLSQMGLNYGSKDAIQVLENCLEIIKSQTFANNIRMAISPTGTTSRILKTSGAIEPDKNSNVTYWEEIDTMAVAQKYLEGGISKTINLKKHHTVQDVDSIIRYCAEKNIKGISVFPAQ